MESATYRAEAAAGTTYCTAETEDILRLFPADSRDDIRKWFKEGYMRQEHITTDMTIYRAIQSHSIGLHGKLITALFAYGFTEGQKYEREIA